MSGNRTLVAAALVAGLALGAVGNADAQQRTISVALSGGQLTAFAPYLAALGSGAFEKRGIKVEEQPFGSGTASFAAFAGGSTNFCICGATQVLTAGANGRDFVAMFNQSHGGAVIFMGHKKYEQERGTDLAKYNGGTWAYTGEGSVSQVFMIKAAQAAGLKWENQKGLAVGTVDAFVPTLRQGRADIVTMDAKSAAQAMLLGIGYPVFNTMEPARVEGIFGRQLGMPLVTTKAVAQNDPKLVQDVADAMREGLMALQRNANDPAAVLKLFPAQFQENNKNDFPQQWQLFKTAFELDGTFSEKAVADTFQFAVQTGALKQPQAASLDPNKYFDNSYAQKALSNVK